MKEKLVRHKKLFVILLLIAAAAVLMVILNSRMQKRRDAVTEQMSVRETAQIEKRTLVESVSATGKVTSAESKSVKADVTGVKVESVNVKVGDRVEEGDVLCILDSESIEEDLADARTTLNASSGKTQIEVSSAERSLSEAQESRNIEAERADEDVAEAWNDYLEALTDLEEAEAEYNDAKAQTVEKNGEYEYRQELLEEAKEKMEQSAGAAGSGSDYESQFNTTKSELVSFVSGIENSALDVESNIYLSADLESISGSVIAPEAGEEVQASIDNYLGTLKGLQSAYQQSAEADSAYEQAKAEYESLSAEVSSWQSKYQTAKSSESSYETAYENAITAADSKLDTYNQKVRSKEDTIRSNDSTVDTKEESLATSKLNATTSGLSEKQQIKQYEEQIEECTVTAPISGIITELNVEAGDTYSGSAIATIEDVSDYEISAEIDEYDISKIEEGQKVIIKTNGTGDTELEGMVKEIAPRATEGSTDVTYNIAISIDTPCDDLKMDMTAKLSIILESRENVLTVPYDAVLEDEDGSFYIEVLKETTEEAKAGEGGEKTEGTQAGAGGEKAEETKAGAGGGTAEGTQAGEGGEKTEGTQAGETTQESEGNREDSAGETGQGSSEGDRKDSAGETGQGSLEGDLKEAGNEVGEQTEKIAVTKGIESDYYVEITGKDLKEGMTVVLPLSADADNDLQRMLESRGPMGGF